MKPVLALFIFLSSLSAFADIQCDFRTDKNNLVSVVLQRDQKAVVTIGGQSEIMKSELTRVDGIGPQGGCDEGFCAEGYEYVLTGLNSQLTIYDGLSFASLDGVLNGVKIPYAKGFCGEF